MYLVNLATLEMDDFLYPSHGSYVDQGCFFNPPVFCWVIGWCFRGQEHIPNAPWHRLKFPPFHQGNPLRDQWKQRFQLRWMAMCLGSCRAVSVEIPKISWLCPKEKFVYPFRRGLYLQSYDLRMWFGPSIPLDRDGSGFLGMCILTQPMAKVWNFEGRSN